MQCYLIEIIIEIYSHYCYSDYFYLLTIYSRHREHALQHIIQVFTAMQMYW